MRIIGKIFTKSCFSPYQKGCGNYIIRSINHEMYVQKLRKSTLSVFDEKRCYINNIETEISIHWVKLHRNSTDQLSYMASQPYASEHSWQNSPSM